MTRNEEPPFLFVRAMVAFLALPGMVAFVLPLWLAPRGEVASGARWVGAVPLAAGTLLLLWCVRDFYAAGKGTLAPWTPPRRLVVVGLYRWSRNPMYVSVSLILLGWALWFMSSTLLWYALGIMLAFHLRVVFFEERWLELTHGQAWLQYRARVPRWVGRAKPLNTAT